MKRGGDKMCTINISKNEELKALVKLLTDGATDSIFLQDEDTVAEIKLVKDAPQPIQFGLGNGLFKVPDDIHVGDDAIQEVFKEYISTS